MKKKQVPSDDSGAPTVAVAVREAQPPSDTRASKAKRVLRRVADGASLRAACREEGLSRYYFLRRIERDAELRARFQFSLASRAHHLVDELLDIADGNGDANASARSLVDAVERIAPQHRDSVVKGILAQQVQRDRLRADMRRWTASKLLGPVYGSANGATAATDTTIRGVFDSLPDGRELPTADFEILPTNNE